MAWVVAWKQANGAWLHVARLDNLSDAFRRRDVLERDNRRVFALWPER